MKTDFLKKHFLGIIIFLFALIEAIYIYHITLEYQEVCNYNNSSIKTIDSLIDVLNKKRDSIIYKIDTIEIEKQRAYNDFKETFNNVSDFSIESDIEFFSNYISEFSRRFSDIDNSEPVENN